MSKLITETDFRDAIIDNNNADEICFALGRKMAIDFQEWVVEYTQENKYYPSVKGKWYKIDGTDTKEKITTEQLFELYQQQKQ